MALTFGTIVRHKLPRAWQVTCPVTFDSAYATGGESFTANDLGLGAIDAVIGINCDDGYAIGVDLANLKVQAFCAIAALTETIGATMTDGGTTSGTQAFAGTIPARAIPFGSGEVTSVAFSGNTSATIQVGITGDVDRFSVDTGQSVFATGTKGSFVTAADALDGASAAQTPLVTITSTDDFTNVNTLGRAAVSVYYSVPTAGLTEAAAGTDLSAVVATLTVIGR